VVVLPASMWAQMPKFRVIWRRESLPVGVVVVLMVVLGLGPGAGSKAVTIAWAVSLAGHGGKLIETGWA